MRVLRRQLEQKIDDAEAEGLKQVERFKRLAESAENDADREHYLECAAAEKKKADELAALARQNLEKLTTMK
jgi:hypothetical protein